MFDIAVHKLKFRSGSISTTSNIGKYYSIVKDSSVDLGVNSKIVQIRPTVKAVSTKISKMFFLHI